MDFRKGNDDGGRQNCVTGGEGWQAELDKKQLGWWQADLITGRKDSGRQNRSKPCGKQT